MLQTFLSLLKADATREQLEDWCRSQTQSYSSRGAITACRVLGKYIMYVRNDDSSIAPHLILDGIWEPWITMAIARHVKPGMCCLDVGACYGYYALLMKDIVGESGHVQAWEPVWGALAHQNAAVNGLEMLVLREAMASEKSVLEIRFPNVRASELINAGDVPMRPARGLPGYTNFNQVSASPPEPESFDFIKIDVEGAEADVWKALEGVRKLSPKLTVCMEFTPSKHVDPMA